MAHRQQRKFFEVTRKKYPQAFHQVRVVDCGSLDVNGCLRDLFTESEYIGVDVRSGQNVDLVSPIHEVPLPDGAFDTVVSAEMLEHDPYWVESLQRMYALCKPGGWIVLSAAAPGRKEHGTSQHPDAGVTYGVLPAYYRNISAADLRFAFQGLPFAMSKTSAHLKHCDIYFVGQKQLPS